VLTSTLNNSLRPVPARRVSKSQSGFTLLEMVVAMMVTMIGLLGLATAIGYALMITTKSQTVTNSKLMIVATLEQMETLRNTQELTFGQIANTGSVDNSLSSRTFAGFPTGFQQVSTQPGADGIYGTADDLINGSGVVDQTLAVHGYTRQIAITSLSPNLKRIQVTLKYKRSDGTTDTLSGVSYLNNDARSSFIP
jgi:prepilin-type N-terminal cleavage/methylation domain-containing protein